jgi:DNA-binding transcriptional LysR family regulator
VNETEGLLDAVRLGLGVGQMPDLLAQDALDRGELVELLPDLRPEPMAIQLVYPPGACCPAACAWRWTA